MNALNKKQSRFLLLLAGCALLAIPAYAGKTDMQTLNVAAPTSKKMEKADYRALESAGLYKGATEGGLGKDLWKGTRRSALVTLLQDMPAASKEPAVQKLIFGALLSETDAGMIDNDIPPEPGRDILTLRLEKLIQAGAYKQAQDIYSSFDEIEPYHDRLARAGILAMMLNGEKSLACVEAETSKEIFPESEFIKQILAFCDVTLSDTPSEDSKNIIAALNLKNADLITANGPMLSYTPESFDGLSLIEKAFLTAEKQINFENSSFKDFDKIPPEHIRILLTDDNLSSKSRFLLMAAAEDWGIAETDEMIEMYKATVPPAGGQDLGSLQVPERSENWEKIAYFYTIATNTEDKAAVWPAIRNGFAAGNHYGIGSLKPYADLITKLQPEGATEAEIETAVRLFNAAGKPVPPQWIEPLEKGMAIEENSISDQRLNALKVAAKLSENKGKIAPEEAANVFPAGSRSGYLLNKIIENVDKPADNSDNANRIYEKEYGLTFKHDYVMPSSDVWNRLKKSGESNNTGETVLLSASVLQGSDLGNIYPEVLTDALTGLNNVGLTDISTNIAIAAVLGSIQKN